MLNLNDKEGVWKAIKGELEVITNPSHFKTHIPGSYIKSINQDDKVIEITCGSDFQRLFIEDRMYGHIKQVVSKLIDPTYKLMFSVTKKEPVKLSFEELGPLFKASKEEVPDAVKIRTAGLNERYTFDRYVVGSSNRLAYAVSMSIADDPGNVYNPFFLYSGVGLGKTHLIQAIGHQILKKHPGKKVMYKTGEQFLNEVIDAMRKGQGGNRGKMSEFKNLYRNLDVLIIDDIHAIAGKETTQEEFFHTFNALYMSRKQIILTSDRTPTEIKTLEARLSSRFASGMIADIQQPDLETKIAILKERNEELKLQVPEEIISFVASIVNTNIRELEAKLLQLATTAKTLNTELNIDLTTSLLGKIDQQKQSRISPNTIVREVCKYYGVTVKDVKGVKRTKNLVIPRQISMFLMREMIQYGYQEIGNYLGDRDHSTVIHGVSKVSETYTTDISLKKEIDQIKTNIKTTEA